MENIQLIIWNRFDLAEAGFAMTDEQWAHFVRVMQDTAARFFQED